MPCRADGIRLEALKSLERFSSILADPRDAVPTNERQPSRARRTTGASAEAAKSLAKPLVGHEAATR